MTIPTLAGIIDRRMLINYRVDPTVLQNILPPPFRPVVVGGFGMAGICLIRLKHVRPKGLPEFAGLSSENGAHRIAVTLTENGVSKQGVYIPRRDTSSAFNTWVGGRLFPGVHHRAAFTVNERQGHLAVSFTSADGTFLSIDAEESNHWNPNSVFENLEQASDFFKNGSHGYSPDTRGAYDGLALKAFAWKVTPLQVQGVRSSFFEDRSRFPEGAVTFDNALLMKNIAHEWDSLATLRTEA
ncbi:DUF2071 domain-containing protein [Chryseolinea lacunae]|uniref:DUF2071 domain-containing protein n=1 Tax=Chryseolinea lacunae TaxID=2801331 RepID=A0ABS1KLU2_9BACT|nr:DUF2071 domain-containing protein [Chryseolinea lacunae]MBL0740424.1 DUF2071 domain-containing protein [Chryseolinea lacunae]